MSTHLSDLKESNEFLNLLLDNINSAVLIADENMQIHQFNDSFLSLFDRATDQRVDSSFGQIAGCVNAVAENRSCGETSQCQFCSIRRSLLQTLLDEAPVHRRRLERQFYISAYVLDVCGHGVSAALVAVTVTQFLQGLQNRMRLTGKLFTPEAVLDRLNSAFPLDRFDSFFTIAYVSLNVKTGKLTYGNAGHEPPLVLKPDGTLQVLAHHGTVIGSGFDAAAYGQDAVTLSPGDRLILYTDGLTDNFGPDGERDGRERFYDALRAMAANPVDDLVQTVFEQTRALRGKAAPTDDMSLVAIEYTA